MIVPRAPAERVATAGQPATQIWPETGIKLFAEALPDPCFILDRRGIVALRQPKRDCRLFDPARRTVDLPPARSGPGRRLRSRRQGRAGGAHRVRRARADRALVCRLVRAPRCRRRDERTSIALVIDDLSERRRSEQHPRRLRRQCQPRAPHAARLASRLHRDAAGPGARGPAGARTVPQDHARPGDADEPAGRRSPVAFADRDEGASCRPSGEVDLSATVQHVTDSLEPLARELGVAIETDLPPGQVDG